MNVLIALLDEDHPHHDVASNWFVLNSELGWTTCPMTQNGCIRILSQPRYPSSLNIREVVEGLRTVTAIESHQFIPDDISLISEGVIDISVLSSHRQLTDVYLLALAVRHEMRFVTLDRGVQLAAVSGASEKHLIVI